MKNLFSIYKMTNHKTIREIKNIVCIPFNLSEMRIKSISTIVPTRTEDIQNICSDVYRRRLGGITQRIDRKQRQNRSSSKGHIRKKKYL